MAIDESTRTSKKRFEAAGVEHTEENRRLYRQLLVTAPGAEKYISGYIMFDETLRQKTDDGVPFPEVLSDRGILPGIKVDLGGVDFADHPGEKVTEGLDGLEDRLKEYVELGAKFAKWRAIIAIGEGIPTEDCIRENAKNIALYAKACQEAGIVPIIEPEVLIKGDHSIERSYEVHQQVLSKFFEELKNHDVYLEGAILKSSMVISGADAPDRADAETVAAETVKCLKEHVPENLAGIVFLSGGQADEEAALHLSLMNQIDVDLPWPLTFSYGRAIQNPAMKIWSEDITKVKEAQAALVFRSKMNSLAAKGIYKEEMEEERPY